jgi:hypothetical protein
VLDDLHLTRRQVFDYADVDGFAQIRSF